MVETIHRRSFIKLLFAAGAVLTGSGGVSALLSGCERTREISLDAAYDFLEHLGEAAVMTTDERFVQKTQFSILGDVRPTLFEHPDSTVVFKDILIGADPRLVFAIGVAQDAWKSESDGVLFEIIITDEKEGHCVYSRFIDPGHNPQDRRWFEEVVELKPFEGKTISCTFKTTAGPQRNNLFDWAGWSEPHLAYVARKTIRKTSHKNIILITLDTTRADHLSCYGYSRNTSPNLDKLAQRGLLFLNAISPSPWTIPAHASLFTGLFPSQHGAITKQENDVLSGYPLPQSDVVLARLLKSRGWNTAGFVGGPFLTAEFGFSQGFDTYDDQWEGFDRKADMINQRVFSWLEKNYGSPFFLFINYFDPHAPYNPPQSFVSPFKADYRGDIDFTMFGPHDIKLKKMKPLMGEDVQRAIDLYDTEILFTDRHLGKLLEALDKFGVLDNALLIITADHGEGFGENDCWGHGNLPVESQVHVPLVVFCPRQRKSSGVIRPQIQTSSVFSTILRFLDISPPHYAHTVPWYDIDVFAADGRGERSLPPYTFAERYYPKGYLAMLRSNTLKYLINRETGEQGGALKEWLFDLGKDPRELHSLLGLDKARDARMRSQFAGFRDGLDHVKIAVNESSGGDRREMNKEMRDKLKALGYVR